jgi:hypothetical protein
MIFLTVPVQKLSTNILEEDWHKINKNQAFNWKSMNTSLPCDYLDN